jgi:hypothetical protein
MNDLEESITAFVEAVRQQFLPDDTILERATPRWEYRKCDKWTKDKNGFWWSTCQRCFHGNNHFCQGPYLYLYWKENGKLRKKYLGKKPDEYLERKGEKCYSQFSNLGNRSKS